MSKLFLGAAGLVLAATVASSANAATTVYTPGDTQFQVASDPLSGTVSASTGHAGIAAGAFTDVFEFTFGQAGLGSSAISTSTSIFKSLTNLDISSVTFNGSAATKFSTANDLYESFFISDVPVTAGVLNSLVITGISRGNGSYGGNLTFEPAITAVPEASTWMMLILGFGLAGVSMRYRRKSVTVSYA